MPSARPLRPAVIVPVNRKNAPGPPSPTFSDATHASAMNFGVDGPEKIITRANLKAGIQSYEDLMNTSANYRAALLAMSKATSEFADAMEKCAGLKGPGYETGTRIQAASGLHHLMGNHWHVLAETIDRKFERPLRQHLDTYRAVVTERSLSYEKELYAKSQIIRRTEMRNMNRKERNLQSFREALQILQRQVDDLDELKARHYQEIMEHEEEVWSVVQGKVSLVVRSTMDIFDKFTSKASDATIEQMLQAVPDPFDAYGPPPSEDQIFSILPPLSIMTAPSPSSTPLLSTPVQASIPVPTWASTTGGTFPDSDSQWADVPPSSTPPRSVSPPSTIGRRHSIPPASGHHPRKAESKLRTVLSIVDEGDHSRHPTAADDALTESVPPAFHGNGSSSEAEARWETSPYNGNEDPTPRNSTLFASESNEPPDPVSSPSQDSSPVQVHPTT